MSDIVSVTPAPAAVPASQDHSYDSVRPIAGMLGLDTHNLSDSDTESVQAVYDYLRGDKAEMTELELLSQLRSLEQRLGMTSLGERRVDKVYRYVKLQSQIESLTKQRDRELR